MTTEAPPSRTEPRPENVLRRNGAHAGRQKRRRSAADRRDRHGRRPGRSAVRARVSNGEQPGAPGRVGPRRAGRACSRARRRRRRPTCRRVMDDSIAVVQRHKQAGTLLNDEGKIAETVLADLGERRLLGPVGRQGIRRRRCAVQLVRAVPDADGARRSDRRRPGVGPWLHRRRRSGAHVRQRRAEAAVPARPGRRRAAQRVRAHRAVRRQRSHGAAHDRAARRRRLRRQRREAVHHQRRARPHDRPGVPDRRRAGRARSSSCRRKRTSTSSSANTACGR